MVVLQITDLLSLVESPLDTVALTKLLHERGINLRYLGRIAGFCAKYHIKHVEEMCVQEMIVRAAKHVLHEVLRQVRPQTGTREDHWFLAPAAASFLSSFLGTL